MQNQLITMMMNQLKMKQPQMFQLIEQARKNQSNPMEMFRDVTKNYTPEQMDSLINRARQFGIPEDVLQQIQNKK
jgi:hypothetical protein